MAESIYEFTATDIEGKPVELSRYRGQVVLIVNVASKCGFTGQYADLQALYEKYKDRGFVILGFPANDFLWQEPGTNADIQQFCTLKYGVTFPMFAKIHVRGSEQHPLYAYLTSKRIHPELGGRITWNFHKFLVGRDGKLAARFGSRTNPASKEVAEAVEKALSARAPESKTFEEDTIKTSAGDLKITFIGHGTLMFTFAGKVIHVDPVSREADYAKLPKADVIAITHEHRDHLDPDAIQAVRKEDTAIVLTETCAATVAGGLVMKNGETRTIKGLRFEAVPAYNLVHERSPGVPFHPRGRGNGYVITFGDRRVYVAGDTENTPEMKALKDIDIAFLPMNLPYTMTPEMVADAAKAFRPRILYPYHTGKTDTSKLVKLLAGEKGIEVRIRLME